MSVASKQQHAQMLGQVHNELKKLVVYLVSQETLHLHLYMLISTLESHSRWGRGPKITKDSSYIDVMNWFDSVFYMSGSLIKKGETYSPLTFSQFDDDPLEQGQIAWYDSNGDPMYRLYGLDEFLGKI